MGRKNSITEVKLTPKEIKGLEVLLHQEIKMPSGGLRIKRCNCGRATYYSKGGVRFRMCSKCGIVPEFKIK